MIISIDIGMTLIILTIIQIKTKSLSKQHEKETSSIWKTVSIKKKKKSITIIVVGRTLPTEMPILILGP